MRVENERRRSPRIMFSIPVRVRGRDAEGERFEVTGRTITLSRHGARLQLPRLLKAGEVLHVLNQFNRVEGDFRVAGPLAPPVPRRAEWGIDCLGENEAIWGVRFPRPSETGEARALLECRRCNSLALQPLSLVEVEVLETAGLLSNPCTRCGASTPWGYPVRAFEEDSKIFQAVAERGGRAEVLEADRRNAPRQAVQLPSRLRNYYGEREFVQTENNSPEGFCFVSDREYLIGQGILVICPYNAEIPRPELSAHIVREGAAGGPAECLYGARFDRSLH